MENLLKTCILLISSILILYPSHASAMWTVALLMALFCSMSTVADDGASDLLINLSASVSSS